MIDRPWQKVLKGRERFEQIVLQHHHRSYNAELKEDLIGMLSDCKRYKPVSLQLSVSVLHKDTYFVWQLLFQSVLFYCLTRG